MILDQNTATVERNNVQHKDVKFQIAATGKAFEILSSGIYKDAISAILRELGANAADAHKMANKPDVRFHVKLPTWDSPYFEIKDQGVGLTPDQIVGVFTVYFTSDKTHSNELTGGFGLGAKSPFSYTDQFKVVSVTGGFKRTYTCYMDEEGAPSMNMLHEAATDEPTGVTISFPVKNSDFSAFRDKAIRVYRWFSPRPIVEGVPDNAYPDNKFRLKGTDWAITGISTDNPVVVMGNVGYPIEKTDLKSNQNFMGLLSEGERAMIDVGPVFYVDIGDVSIAASRESLKFTPLTMKTLKDRLAKAAAGAWNEMQSEVAKCKTLWDARVLVRDYKQTSYLSAIIQSKPLTWCGIPVKTLIGLGYKKNPNDYRDTAMVKAIQYTLQSRYRRGQYVKSITSMDVDRVDPTKNTYLFVNTQLNTGHIARLEHFLKTRGDDNASAILFHEAELKTADFAKREQLEDVIKEIATLPEPPKVVRTPEEKAARKKTAKILRLKEKGYYQEAWSEVDVNLDDGGVYFEVNGYDIILDTSKLKQTYGTTSVDSFRAILANIANIPGLKREELVGVRRASLKKFTDQPKWTRLEDEIKKYINANAAKMVDLVYRDHVWDRIKFGPTAVIADLEGKGVPADCLLSRTSKALSPFRKAAEDQALINNYAYLLRLGGIDVPPAEDEAKKLQRRVKACGNRYPLVQHVGSSPALIKPLLQYIRMIEKTEAPVDEAALATA